MNDAIYYKELADEVNNLRKKSENFIQILNTSILNSSRKGVYGLVVRYTDDRDVMDYVVKLLSEKGFTLQRSSTPLFSNNPDVVTGLLSINWNA